MPYVLCRMVLGRTHTLRATKAEYENVKLAKRGLQQIISVEEKFDAVMENFVELEETLLTLGMRHLAFETLDYNEFLKPTLLISRRISNLLSTAWLYRDALPQHIKVILAADKKTAKELEKSLKDRGKQPMSYRIVEAIRNYTQHQQLPVSGITFDSRREHVDKATQKAAHFAYSVIPKIDAVAVSQRREIKSDVRAALVALGDNVDPMKLIREYVEHVGTIHASFRAAVAHKEKEWDQTIRGLIARYLKRVRKETHLGIAIGFQHANRTISGAEHLVLDRLEYRKYLTMKNHSTVNLSKRYVKW